MKISSQKVLAQRVAKIVRACRKNVGISQVALARELGIDQSALSRVESCRQNLTAQQWFHFCNFVGISAHSLSSGLIEISRNPEQKGSEARKLKLPERYSKNALSKVRSVQPLIQRFQEKLGEKQLNSFMENLGLDSDYFVDLNNQINFNFCIDISRHLIKKKMMQKQSIEDLTQYAMNPDLQGSFRYQFGYFPQQDRLHLFEVLNSNIRRYGENFTFEVIDVSKASFDIAVTPLPHMVEFNYLKDSLLGDFFCQYNRSYLSKFLASDGAQPVQVDVSENHYLDPGAKRCVYKVYN